MSKWKLVCLGEVARIQGGYAFKSTDFVNDGVPIIRIGNLNGYTVDLDNDVCFPQEFWERNEIFRIKYGDILVAMSGATVGKVGRYLQVRPALLNQRVGLIRVDKSKVYPNYVYQYVKSSLFLEKIQQAAFGCAQPNISAKQIENIVFPLPPLETQKQIAKTLDTASELLGMRKKQLAELENLIKSTFYAMFGDPDNNPYGWDVSLLSETAEIVSGITKGRKLSDASTKSVPYMRVANVQDGHLVLSEIKHIEALDSEIERYRLINGDLLMTEGGDPDKLGRCAIWNGEIPISIHQNHIFRVRLNQDRILPEYTSFLIGSIYGKKYFLKAAKQTTGIATINSKQLGKFPLLIPDIHLQLKFSEIVTKIEEQKALVKKAIDETQYLFDSLMAGYFE